MKILYDYQIFESQRVGGISRYFFEIISHLGNDATWQLPVVYSNNLYITQLPELAATRQQIPPKIDPLSRFMFGRSFIGKRTLYKMKTRWAPVPQLPDPTTVNKTASINAIKAGNFDIFHPTYYDGYFLEYLEPGKPLVLTVYDLIHQVFPEFALYEKRDKNQQMLDRANAVIAISESTKKDLVTLFDIPEEKVSVIHLANSLQEPQNHVSLSFTNKLPESYILFVGERSNYKNFLFFSQVFATLCRQHKNLQVVCAGAPFTKDENYQFEKLGIKQSMYATPVSDDELSYLYKHATAFIFPSMYEGFGIPVLEAFSFGCPVLLSRTSSLLEVAGAAGIYFEPKDAASMLAALQGILTDTNLRTQKIKEGYEQLQKFSWQGTADQTRLVYQQVLGS